MRSSAATWRTAASGPSPPPAPRSPSSLHNLPDRAQRFVVGVTLRGEFARKERQGTARPLMFVVLDELNKYAPREGDSPIKQILLDVAERGRSLGVILIGARQAAADVERRILANCAIRIAGRLDAPRPNGPTRHRSRDDVSRQSASRNASCVCHLLTSGCSAGLVR
jgi:DNA helicase HerA-like ATPase